jgi:2-polyprenyl-3-methyl-5-hydroxy-6-metoxy-1,4-benzoquinol methylase/predicted GNAT family acetyltransferase
MSLRDSRNQADATAILAHLQRCDHQFVPALSSRVNLCEYAAKLATRAERFEVFEGDMLVALVAVYINADSAFISNVSVEDQLGGQGVGSRLVRDAVTRAFSTGVRQVRLETDRRNRRALKMYSALGFSNERCEGDSLYLVLHAGDLVTTTRNYNQETADNEERRYAYSFDFDVMHPFMIRSFKPFMIGGKLLELGSFEGAFTQRLAEHCQDITCVEASSEAARIAAAKLGSKATIVNDRFETVALNQKYDTVIMTHVLEHLDDPVAVMARVNNEWLTESGRFLLACPNANAPSRQIAVKMGLISHNAAVTSGEHEHGHRITYSLDTLERDARAAGLDVIHRGGIFFKALANFQWDRLLQTDIISPEYLEGCYMLGQHYPDLCSSIFIVCEKGTTKI